MLKLNKFLKLSVLLLTMQSSCAEYSISKKKGATPVFPAGTPAPEITAPPVVPPIPAGLGITYLPLAPKTNENVDVTAIGCDEGAAVAWRLGTTSLDQTKSVVKLTFHQAGTYQIYAQCAVSGVQTEAQASIVVVQGTATGNCGTGCCCCCCSCCYGNKTWRAWSRSSSSCW